MKYFKIGECNARKSELEKQLDCVTPKIFKIKACNERVLELEQMLVAARVPEKTPQQKAPVAATGSPGGTPAAPPPTPAVKLTGMDALRAGIRADIAKSLAAPAAISKAPAEASQVSRAQLEAILKIAQPTANDMPKHWDLASCRIEAERACFQIHLNFSQFMASDVSLQEEYHRSAEKPTGTRLYLRAEAKRKIEAVLASR